jgi:hypothetical protein
VAINGGSVRGWARSWKQKQSYMLLLAMGGDSEPKIPNLRVAGSNPAGVTNDFNELPYGRGLLEG